MECGGKRSAKPLWIPPADVSRTSSALALPTGASELRAGSGSLARGGAAVQPHINAGRVPGSHAAVKQVVSFPIGSREWVAGAFVPAQRPGTLPRRDNDLGMAGQLDEFPDPMPPADDADFDRFELPLAEIFEPVIA